MQNILGMGLVGGMDQVPENLKFILVFPYTSGLRFVHSLLQEGGYKKINEAFEHPPRSTEEILHAEKAKEKEPDFKTIPVSEVLEMFDHDTGKGFSVTFSDSVGEFVTSLALANYVDRTKAIEASNGWGGDTVIRTVDIKTNERTIAWKTRWDIQRDAHEFYEAMKESLEKRYGVHFSTEVVSEKVVVNSKVEITLAETKDDVFFMEKKRNP